MDRRMKGATMKAYMWRAKNGDWLYMLGDYGSVHAARTAYAVGVRFALVPHHRSMGDAADVARRHARRMPEALETGRRLGLPLAA